jgi:hypothetical protein
VARLLVGVEHNPWFEFEDDNGHGFCSPDLLLVGTKRTLVLECKLSDGAQGWMQVSGLYAPVLRGVFGMEVVPVVVTRTLRRGSVVAHSLREAVERAAERPVLHYIGHGPFPLD